MQNLEEDPQKSQIQDPIGNQLSYRSWHDPLPLNP